VYGNDIAHVEKVDGMLQRMENRRSVLKKETTLKPQDSSDSE
jgi:hypothetical protein